MDNTCHGNSEGRQITESRRGSQRSQWELGWEGHSRPAKGRCAAGGLRNAMAMRMQKGVGVGEGEEEGGEKEGEGTEALRLGSD